MGLESYCTSSGETIMGLIDQSDHSSSLQQQPVTTTTITTAAESSMIHIVGVKNDRPAPARHQVTLMKVGCCCCVHLYTF